MNEKVVLDTETTGLSQKSDRIIEIGCVELIDEVPSGKVYHTFINPMKEVAPDAEKVHGLSNEFLADKPLFGEVAEEFLAFIGSRPLIIHNAPFDLGFLNAELNRLSRPYLTNEIIDTLAMARKADPTRGASLDVLCKRFGVDTSKRTKHGALIDCDLLAQVYLHLIGGPQRALTLEKEQADAQEAAVASKWPLRPAKTWGGNIEEDHAAFCEKFGFSPF